MIAYNWPCDDGETRYAAFDRLIRRLFEVGVSPETAVSLIIARAQLFADPRAHEPVWQ